MKTVMCAILVVLGMCAILSADTWTNVSLIDSMCLAKVKDNPDQHTKKCAIQCGKGDLGVVTSEGNFYKLDESGQAQALAALQKSDKTDHLRVNVEGTLKDDVIQVKSIELQ